MIVCAPSPRDLEAYSLSWLNTASYILHLSEKLSNGLLAICSIDMEEMNVHNHRLDEAFQPGQREGPRLILLQNKN